MKIKKQIQVLQLPKYTALPWIATVLATIPNYISYNNCSGIPSKASEEESHETLSHTRPLTLTSILWSTAAGWEPQLVEHCPIAHKPVAT